MDLNEYWAKGDGTTIQQHNNDLLHCLEVIKNMGYIKSEHLYSLLKSTCIYHDYGKANIEFQKRVKSPKKIIFDPNTEIAHNVLSMYFINKQDFEDYNDYLKVLFAVGFHHNYSDVLNDLKDKKELANRLLSDFDTYKINVMTRNKLSDIMTEDESILLKGFLHKCDYCASAGCISELKNDFLAESVDSLGYSWNNMQNYCADNTDDNIIVIAQTGMGKTEGALKWIGNNKGFFVLPLKTAINAMYDRISSNIIKADVENRLAVLHSESINYLINNISNEELDIIEYNEKGRKLSMPLTVTTMDQLFDFVFLYNGYEMKLTTFSYSKIVIDEIQMYGPELLAYLIYGIERIIEIGGKVAIVTATLSPFIRDLLGDKFKYNEFIDDSLIRHNVCVKEDFINSEDILCKYNQNKQSNKPNKILAICNTIKKAQELYDEIIDSIDDEDKDNVNLFHTRFTKYDRAKKEKDILKVGSSEGKLNQIWITTSVVEASLDIDFDYLFTELQDINSLFQRFGRCNRKGIKSAEEYNCFVYTEINPKIIKYKKGKTGFIDETIYKLSKEAVLTVDGVLTESAKLKLLNTYFTSDNLKYSDFMNQYRYYYRLLKELNVYSIDPKDVELRHIASVQIIPSSIYNDKIDYFDDLKKQIENEKGRLNKIKLMDKLRSYVVDIPYYELNYNAVKETVKINGKSRYYVMDCLYDSKTGFKVDRSIKNYDYATFW